MERSTPHSAELVEVIRRIRNRWSTRPKVRITSESGRLDASRRARVSLS